MFLSSFFFSGLYFQTAQMPAMIAGKMIKPPIPPEGPPDIRIAVIRNDPPQKTAIDNKIFVITLIRKNFDC